ncbi:MAG: flavodoxin family protein [Firmicutes bacterium]|nr:flavodoxin family protein [Bacillota bacterium]
MLKVIAINSSKRKINTYGLIIQVKEILAKKDIEVEIINLYDYEIKNCLGCEHCIITDDCVLKDDVSEIMRKIENSDGIILTSPVYLQTVSGMMKIFIDRTCKWFHRPVLYGKPILVMSTTKGSGLKATLKYLEKVVVQWGAINAGSIGRGIRNIETPISLKECKEFISLLKMEKKDYKPSLDSLINYQVQKILADFMSGLDENYWREKGWNKKFYYFNCKINIFKRMIATLIYKVISRAMQRSKNSQNN